MPAGIAPLVVLALSALLPGVALTQPATGVGWFAPWPEPEPPAARLALIIDDIGDDRALGERSVALPGPITLSVLPHTPHARSLARAAHEAGHEVMLHMPMQAKSGADPGPGALMLDMDEEAVRAHTLEAWANIPEAVGANNHMGSLLTRHPGHMAWVMAALNEAGADYFIDSRTSAHSVAHPMAQEAGLAHGRRHVFLDAERDEEAIAAQLERAVRIAEQSGEAIAIGHPYPETLRVLETRLAELNDAEIHLVPASTVTQRPDSDGEGRNARQHAGPPEHAGDHRGDQDAAP